ncbi:hypothetical protein [Blastococcus sp. TF02-8]|uniref:hypothetical protein n=1 Tax=Blastococcus sp. TF02-8 TaxID=2250574 RepID=UPI00141315C7|nr:hypothetical protein [Blastococcus sp. TF02-8]
MSTTYHPNKKSTSAVLDRCLRHHVWMAACADCRTVHARPNDQAEGSGGPAT